MSQFQSPATATLPADRLSRKITTLILAPLQLSSSLRRPTETHLNANLIRGKELNNNHGPFTKEHANPIIRFPFMEESIGRDQHLQKKRRPHPTIHRPIVGDCESHHRCRSSQRYVDQVISIGDLLPGTRSADKKWVSQTFSFSHRVVSVVVLGFTSPLSRQNSHRPSLSSSPIIIMATDAAAAAGFFSFQWPVNQRSRSPVISKSFPRFFSPFLLHV